MFETKTFLIQFNTPIMWSLNADPYAGSEPSVVDYGLDLTFDYMFSASDITPYAGGGTGMHFIVMEAGGTGFGTNFGMTFSAGGGLLMLRTYDFHLFLDARYHINIAEIPSFQGPHHAFKLNIGFVYRMRQGCGGGGCGGGRGGCM